MEVINIEKLTLEIENQFYDIIISFKGECDFFNPSESLTPAFNKISSKIKQFNVIFDFLELQHLNSSSIGFLIQYFKDLNKVNKKVTIRYNGRITWQKMFFCKLPSMSFLKNVKIVDIPQ